MLQCHESGDLIQIETSALRAGVLTSGFVTGVTRGSFVDKATGVCDPGMGLHIMDFLGAPGWRDNDYTREPRFHGDIPKHIVEGPQICTRAGSLPHCILRGEGHVAIRQWFTFTQAGEGAGRERPYEAGSRWEQTLLFLPDTPYFFSCETIACVNEVDGLFYRIDMPTHIRHDGLIGTPDCCFRQVYLSYEGAIPAEAFREDFPPDARYRYVRDDARIPERFIRACELPVAGTDRGRWLAGMTLDPASPSEAWCHERGYVCFIQENHGRAVRRGQTIGAAYVVGYFDSVEEMARVYDRFRGTQGIDVDEEGYRLVRG